MFLGKSKIICGNTECEYCNSNLDKPLGRCSKNTIVLVPVQKDIVECKSFKAIKKVIS